ncbi:MAG: MotA/TolQ/ExbB proton channel family protein [Elusimicrobiaceae bacterium]|nr:MotA/TolQ/ExbB proton channel family protein [Elusimicrobiaceae bacterium]
MDVMALLGIICGLGMYSWGIIEGESVSAFLNAHGIVLVIGGTLFATMIYCPPGAFFDVFRAGMRIFFPAKVLSANKAVELAVELGKKARQSGMDSLESDVSAIKDDGFFLRTYHVCLTSADEETARNIIERELIQMAGRHREVLGVFRTLASVSPMMGLMGTVIGIVSVLRNISDPSRVGANMGVAMSTVFYGILLSGLFFNPMGGKLKSRSYLELLSKEIIMEALLTIAYSNMTPSEIERKMVGFLKSRMIRQAVARNA